MVQKISDMQDDINMMSNILVENSNKAAMADKPKLSSNELDRTKQILDKDIQQYNNDLKLLSVLLGRSVKPEDIPKLTANIPGGLSQTKLSTTPVTPTTVASTTKTAPPFVPLSDREVKLLEAINKIQSTTAATTTRKPSLNGKSQEAVLAALLKERGIGPNNVSPEVTIFVKFSESISNFFILQKLLEQLSGRSNQRSPTLRPILTTTEFTPFPSLQDLPPPPRRQPRPILDGLAWLWKTWQETGTTTSRRPASSTSTATGTLSLDEGRPVPLPRPAIGLFPFGSIAPQGGFGGSTAVNTGNEGADGNVSIEFMRFGSENISYYFFIAISATWFADRCNRSNKSSDAIFGCRI